MSDYLVKPNKENPTEVSHLPIDKEYYMIFEEDSYQSYSGYEKLGEFGDTRKYLRSKVVFTTKELEAYVKEQAEKTSSYGKKKFSFVKCLPMSYNISIETKVSVNV